MGGFEPASAAMFALNMIKQNQQAKAQERSARVSGDREISRLRQEQAVRDRQRRDQLKRVQATQRARFGAQGVGRSGSADAVLDGLGAATARNIADDSSAVASRITDINTGVQNIRRRNLLQRRNMVTDRIFGEIRNRLPTISLFDR
jgi:hypothetical protein